MTNSSSGPDGAAREPLVYKPQELVEVLHIGENQVYELIASGRIPAIKFGPRQILVPRQALEQFLVDEAFRQQNERLEPSERQLAIAAALATRGRAEMLKPQEPVRRRRRRVAAV